jgi:DNA-binding CsgD family transcriptional regulator
MPRPADILPPLPIDAARWAAVVAYLALPPQQARIAELVLRGMRDKQIMAELGISRPTLRTYLSRLFLKAGVEGRVELVIRLFTLAAAMTDGGEACPPKGCHPKG